MHAPIEGSPRRCGHTSRNRPAGMLRCGANPPVASRLPPISRAKSLVRCRFRHHSVMPTHPTYHRSVLRVGGRCGPQSWASTHGTWPKLRVADRRQPRAPISALIVSALCRNDMARLKFPVRQQLLRCLLQDCQRCGRTWQFAVKISAKDCILRCNRVAGTPVGNGPDPHFTGLGGPSVPLKNSFEAATTMVNQFQHACRRGGTGWEATP